MGDFMHGLVPVIECLLIFGGIPGIILTGVIMALKKANCKRACDVTH
jgi:hypothetical protein